MRHLLSVQGHYKSVSQLIWRQGSLSPDVARILRKFQYYCMNVSCVLPSHYVHKVIQIHGSEYIGCCGFVNGLYCSCSKRIGFSTSSRWYSYITSLNRTQLKSAWTRFYTGAAQNKQHLRPISFSFHFRITEKSAGNIQ